MKYMVTPIVVILILVSMVVFAFYIPGLIAANTVTNTGEQYGNTWFLEAGDTVTAEVDSIMLPIVEFKIILHLAVENNRRKIVMEVKQCKRSL